MKLPSLIRPLLSTSDVKLVSVDIFDTLLLRRPISQRRRHHLIATSIFSDPDTRGLKQTSELFRRARVLAQELAYSELETSGREGEVRLEDILKRQIEILGLPSDLYPTFLRVEIQVERDVLFRNGPLIEIIQHLRRRGVRIVGLSDTAFCSSDLMVLLDAVAGPDVVDALYTSADLQTTKREGGAFKAIADLEGISETGLHHIGDDLHADCRVPQRRGIRVYRAPRSLGHVIRRRIDAASFELMRWRPHPVSIKRWSDQIPPNGSAARILGPIIAEFCMRLWVYLSSMPNPDRAVVLFCARGGLNMRVAFDRFLSQLDLSLKVRHCDFMVSRLVAIRGALLRNSEAAMQELSREFADSTMADVARALTGCDYDFEPEWHAKFEAGVFSELLRGTPSGEEIYSALAQQDKLFSEHLVHVAGGANRLILCDTGLYGSTIRLLQAGHPEYDWECLLFARMNYKKYSAPHFRKTLGLSVQSDAYTPFNGRTSILRYWQLIEVLFEPALSSVRTFFRSKGGTIVSNLEVAGWRKILESQRAPLFSSVLSYMDSLRPSNWFHQLTLDADRAWGLMRTTIIFPTRADVKALTIPARSRDLGRDEVVGSTMLAKTGGMFQHMIGVRNSFWREGYVAGSCTYLRWPLLACLEVVHIIRGVHSAISWRKAAQLVRSSRFRHPRKASGLPS